jgi:hypothetical protein
MKILDLFDVYFLVIQGSVVLTIDARSFKKNGNDSTSKKARTIGLLAIIIAIILFILRVIF